MRYSTPPLPPTEILARQRSVNAAHAAGRLLDHLAEREVPVELVVMRAERESGKLARIAAASARVELERWRKSVESCR